MFYTVYRITNKINNKIYIGVHRTKDINDNYFGSGRHLRRAIKKYGKENFQKEILFVFENEMEMLNKERELVTEEFCDREDTYNLRTGADGYENSGFQYINENGLNLSANQHLIVAKRLKTDENFRKEFSKKISIGVKKYYEKNGSHWLGRKHSEKSKRLIGQKNSISLLGSRNSRFGKMWITNGFDSRMIDKMEEIPAGWYKGRKMPMKQLNNRSFGQGTG